jgi:hypothetical protein
MKKEPETLDCVAVKRRAQRALAKALAGKSPDEQAEILHRLAAPTPLWKSLVKARAERVPRAVREHAKPRSIDRSDERLERGSEAAKTHLRPQRGRDDQGGLAPAEYAARLMAWAGH